MNPDIALRDDVREQLATILADRIDVQVVDGVVTLTGKVSSDVEKWVVEAAIRYVRGVRGLVNETIVETELPTRQPDADIARPWFP